MTGWIDIEDSLPSHRKTLEVADDLGIEPVQLVGHLTCFWLWATNNADNTGLLAEGIRPKTIARAAMWTGDACHFVTALMGSFLDEDETGRLRVHDWDRHYGRYSAKREKDAERKREWRAKQSESVTERGPDVDATRDGAGREEETTGDNRSVDPEGHTDPSLARAREGGAGPDEPSARAAPRREEPPAEPETRQAADQPEPPPLPFDFCPCCRKTVPSSELEPHFQAHVDAGEIPPQPFGAVQAFLTGRTLRPRPSVAARQPDANAPLTPEQIAEYEQRRNARASPKVPVAAAARGDSDG